MCMCARGMWRGESLGEEIMVTRNLNFDPHLTNHPDTLVCV